MTADLSMTVGSYYHATLTSARYSSGVGRLHAIVHC